MADVDIRSYPEAPDDSSSQLVRWRTLDLDDLGKSGSYSGVRLHWVALDGDGPPILFLHGIGNSLRMWLPAAAEFSKRFRPVLVDLPGFGLSGGSFRDTHIDRVAEILTDFIEAEIPGEDVTVIGHSMGALVSAHLAAAGSDQIKSVINVSGPPLSGVDVLRKPFSAIRRSPREAWALVTAMAVGLLPFKTYWMPRLAGHTWLRKAIFGRFVARPELLDTDLATYIFSDLGNGRTFGAARNGFRYDPDSVYRRTSVPVYVVLGDRDPITSLHDAQRYQQLAEGNGIHVVEGAGHLPMIEQPAAFQTIVGSIVNAS